MITAVDIRCILERETEKERERESKYYNTSQTFYFIQFGNKQKMIGDSSFLLGNFEVLQLLVIILLIVYLLTVKRHNFKSSLPPRVPGVPLLGNVTGVDTKRPHITFTEWSKKYGPVFRISILGQETVVLNDKQSIREALIEKDVELAGRPYIFRIHYGFHYAEDIIFGDWSHRWQKLKRFECF